MGVRWGFDGEDGETWVVKDSLDAAGAGACAAAIRHPCDGLVPRIGDCGVREQEPNSAAQVEGMGARAAGFHSQGHLPSNGRQRRFRVVEGFPLWQMTRHPLPNK